jgi:hypothetical protein
MAVALIGFAIGSIAIAAPTSPGSGYVPSYDEFSDRTSSTMVRIRTMFVLPSTSVDLTVLCWMRSPESALLPTRPLRLVSPTPLSSTR